MSKSARNKKAKAAQAFEQHPPRCASCQNFTPHAPGIPGVREWAPARCQVGGFAVCSHSICDEWLGINGERLEHIEALVPA